MIRLGRWVAAVIVVGVALTAALATARAACGNADDAISTRNVEALFTRRDGGVMRSESCEAALPLLARDGGGSPLFAGDGGH